MLQPSHTEQNRDIVSAQLAEQLRWSHGLLLLLLLLLFWFLLLPLLLLLLLFLLPRRRPAAWLPARSSHLDQQRSSGVLKKGFQDDSSRHTVLDLRCESG